MTTVRGEITDYLAVVGRGAQDGDAVQTLVTKLGFFEAETLANGEGTEDTYWSFYEQGVELSWREQRVRSVTVYVVADDDEGYDAYDGRLFEDLPNTARRSEVEAALGAPADTGTWGDSDWIRYRVPSGYLHFQFLDDRAIRVSSSDRSVD